MYRFTHAIIGLISLFFVGCGTTHVDATPSAATNTRESDNSRQPQASPDVSVPARQCQLQTLNDLYDAPIVLSSIRAITLNNGHKLILFETKSGNIQSMILDEKHQVIASKAIAEYAQIACAEATSDGYRAGMIRRDPQTASFSLDIESFDQNHSSIEVWKASTRGFVPDPGSRCAFLDRRKLIVNGTRPRGDRPPYHGLFVLEPANLTQLEGSQHNEVELLSASIVQSEIHLLAREIRRESDPPTWAQVIYKLNADDTLEEIRSGDFILPDNTIIMRNGCIQSEPDFCIPDIKLTDAQQLSQTLIEYKTKTQAIFIEKSATGYKEIYRTDALYLYPVDDDLWLAAKPDKTQPDIATGLYSVKAGFECR